MTFLQAMAAPACYNPPRRNNEDEYRVELAGGTVVVARLNKAEAIRVCDSIPNRAFVWATGAKMIVYRNWN